MLFGKRLLFLLSTNCVTQFWEIITGSDGIPRHLQWQARVEGKLNTSMTVTQYLGTGSLSRGRMTITRQLNTIVSTPPYLRDEHDREAVIQGITNLRESLKGVANLTWITPPSNVTVEAFVDSVSTNLKPPRAFGRQER
jgi:cellobiose dehydrogenase (acceptor)